VDVCAPVCGLVAVFGVVAVLGVGTWTILRMVLRGHAPRDAAPSPARQNCAVCGGRLQRMTFCSQCGTDTRRQEVRILHDLDITSCQLDRLAESGQLDRQALAAALDAIKHRRTELINQLLPAQPEPVPPLSSVPALDLRPHQPAEQPPPMPALYEPVEIPVVQPPRVDVARPPIPKKRMERATPRPAAPPPRPRRSFAEMTAAFMEARNILWGEVVGGLLIVGCSIALVLSLREKLQQIPYFPFLVLATVTAALIGAGRYSLKHWKLESTSRGLLVIGTLMVPLCFMVLAGLAQGREGGVLEAVTEFGAIGVFAFLVHGAAGILLAGNSESTSRVPLMNSAAVIGASASMLLAPHLQEFDPTGGTLGLVGYVSAGVLVLTQAAAWLLAFRQGAVTPPRLGALFLGLGLAAYSVAVAFAALVFRAGDAATALEYLAAPTALTGLTLLLAGAAATAKMRDTPAEPAVEGGGLSAGVVAVIATLLSLGGALVMLLALGAAWPNPTRLAVIAAMNAVALALAALRFRLAPAYIPAQICLAVAAVTGWHLACGHFAVPQTEWAAALLQHFNSAESGVVILVLSAILAVASEWLARRGQRLDSLYQAAGAGIAALISIAMVTAQAPASQLRTALVLGTVAAGAFLVNLRRRLAWVSVAGAVLQTGAAFFALDHLQPDVGVSRRLAFTLLIGASAALGISLLATARRRDDDESPAGEWERAFEMPLSWTALAISLACPLTLCAALGWDWLWQGAALLAGLGAVFLGLAWQRRDAVLVALFQAALAAAVVLGATWMLLDTPWFAPNVARLLGDIRSWQIYGTALGALSLCWVLARFALRRSSRAWELVEPAWPALDRILLGGLVIACVCVAALGVAPGVVDELTPHAVVGNPAVGAATSLHVHEPFGWCWLGLLAAALTLSLWQERAVSAVVGLTTMAVAVPLMAAGALQKDLAVASAVRWGLALAFVGVSSLLWARRRLGEWAVAAGIRRLPGPACFIQIVTLLISTSLVPVLGLTAVVASLGFSRLEPAGPAAGSLFHWAGPLINTMVPLCFLCAGLTGHGIRQRSSLFTMAGGLIALIAVVGGHALGIVTAGGTIGGPESVQLGQLATGVAGMWLLGWLAVRHWLERHAWPADLAPPVPQACAITLAVQEALLWFSCLAWLMPAALTLAWPGAWSWPASHGLPYVMECGSWLAWVVVAVALVATARYEWSKSGSVPGRLVVWTALLIGVLKCCTISIYWPGQEQRCLMIATASLALVVAAIVAARKLAKLPRWLAISPGAVEELSFVAVAAGITVMLAWQRAELANDHYWAAAAMAIVALAASMAALVLGSGAWMFGSGAALQMAVTLVMCRHFPGLVDPAAETWIARLIQANLAAGGILGLVWLGCRKRFFAGPRETLAAHPWLALQFALLTLANLLVGAAVFVQIVGLQQATPDSFLRALGGWQAFLALAPSVVGAVWLLRELAQRQTIHAIVGAGLLLSNLVAATAAPWDAELGSPWLGYHVMTLGWMVLAGTLLGLSWVSEAMAGAGEQAWPEFCLRLAPKNVVLVWVNVLGGALALLAIATCTNDSMRPAWPVIMLLAVTAFAAAMAIWTRNQAFVYASGAAFNAAGFAFWAHDLNARGFGLVLHELYLCQVLCLAIGSLAWSAVGLAARNLGTSLAERGHFVPFRHLAAWLVVALLGLRALTQSVEFLVPTFALDILPWLTLLAAVGAAAITLWDQPALKSAGPWPQLYVLGLIAIANAFEALRLEPTHEQWYGALSLACYALTASGVCWVGFRWQALRKDLALPSTPWPMAWFLPVQAVVGVLALGLGLWVTTSFELLTDRLAGFAVGAALTFAAALLTPVWDRVGGRAAPNAPRLATLLLGVLACAELHLAFVSPADAYPLLNASALLMLALVWMAGLYDFALPRLAPPEDAWVRTGRRLARELGIAACVMLGLVLVQECALYDPTSGTTPLAATWVWLVALALGGLFAGSLRRALSPIEDKARLTDRARKLHVYLAEALLILVLLHLRLNIPGLFPRLSAHYWALIVMLVAYTGFGLGELCRRRGLHVLSGPLEQTAMLLPVLPLAAFLVRPLALVPIDEHGPFGALHLIPYYLSRLPDDYRLHAAIWLGMGLLYMVAALTRRSSALGLAAAVIANCGLWVVLGNQGHLGFLVHPQLWLVPLGLIVLCAEHINRPRLAAQQSLGLRYTGLLLIYVSSSADMFIKGVGNDALLPIVLALLAVAGVLVGIMVQVRAFLVAGVTFLFLVVFAQIWHAAVDLAQTWVWWASGIVLGAAILALFAWFEKRHNDVVMLIDKLKRWQ
jgi:hypothetical protein